MIIIFFLVQHDGYEYEKVYLKLQNEAILRTETCLIPRSSLSLAWYLHSHQAMTAVLVIIETEVPPV
jgi:hypothetical protein